MGAREHSKGPETASARQCREASERDAIATPVAATGARVTSATLDETLGLSATLLRRLTPVSSVSPCTVRVRSVLRGRRVTTAGRGGVLASVSRSSRKRGKEGGWDVMGQTVSRGEEESR